MNSQYPQNLKESIIFGMSNCIVMVCGMMAVNMFFAGVLTPLNFISGLGPIFLTAFFVSELIVGPIVHVITKKFNAYHYISFIRVAFMAAIMTFLAPLLQTGNIMNFGHYLTAFIFNYIVAFFLQVLVAMRFAIFVLARIRALKNVSRN